MESFLVYAGLLAMLAGLVSVFKPIRFLRLSTPRRGGALLAAGLALALLGAALPARVTCPARKHARMEDFLPCYQFHEVHSTRVHASPDRIFQAIKTVTPEEIRFFRTLTWIRSPRLPGKGRTKETILSAPPKKPILDVALHSGFLLLAEEADHELVVGTIVCCGGPRRIASAQEFLRLDNPDYAKAALNFLVKDEGTGWSRVTTETRVFATDAAALRRFAVYWRIIYPGSALIRRMWLKAIQRRAEHQP